jgi:hypothetical protein
LTLPCIHCHLDASILQQGLWGTPEV